MSTQIEPKFDFEALDNLFHDKKIKPVFWIITALYFAAVLYFLFFYSDYAEDYYSDLIYIFILLIPYFIFSTIYILWVHRKDKKTQDPV